MRDRVAALEPGEHLGRRVPAVERVGAVGADEQARSAALLGQAFEEGDALGVGPVQVVEHDDARRSASVRSRTISSPSRTRSSAGRSVSARSSRRSSSFALPVVEGVEEQLERAAERARDRPDRRRRPCRRGAGRSARARGGSCRRRASPPTSAMAGDCPASTRRARRSSSSARPTICGERPGRPTSIPQA